MERHEYFASENVVSGGENETQNRRVRMDRLFWQAA
jgi:hypothetical protein